MFDLQHNHPRRRVAIGSDNQSAMTDALVSDLRERGFELELLGALGESELSWPQVGRTVGEVVAAGGVDFGIVCCWTGTGVCIAANKVHGIRAALCNDAQTAAGARRWNDANVLALSLRLVTPALAHEILEAWLTTAPSEEASDRAAIAFFE